VAIAQLVLPRGDDLTQQDAGVPRPAYVGLRTDSCEPGSVRYRDLGLSSLIGNPMSSPKPIQIILARQLASSLAVPILLVDPEGTLIFYNESAEVILDQRFEETGEMPADAWTGLFAIADEARNPIAPEDRPTMLAISERKPFSRTVWMRCGRHEWLHVNITAYPLIGEARQFLGVKMLFWEL
jgi:PAS domain-containing protein